MSSPISRYPPLPIGVTESNGPLFGMTPYPYGAQCQPIAGQGIRTLMDGTPTALPLGAINPWFYTAAEALIKATAAASF